MRVRSKPMDVHMCDDEMEFRREVYSKLALIERKIDWVALFGVAACALGVAYVLRWFVMDMFGDSAKAYANIGAAILYFVLLPIFRYDYKRRTREGARKSDLESAQGGAAWRK